MRVNSAIPGLKRTTFVFLLCRRLARVTHLCSVEGPTIVNSIWNGIWSERENIIIIYAEGVSWQVWR
jgi:hypothetical protein